MRNIPNKLSKDFYNATFTCVMSRYYEYMPSKNYEKDSCTNVVKSLACMRIANFNYQHSHSKLFLAKRVLLLLMAFLFSFSFILPTLPINSLIFSPLNRVNTINAYAESNEQNSGIVATDSITDTENLLGDSVSKVADMIETTKKRTGVNVRLLYLSTFGNTKNPSKWASDLLISTLPAKNTVLLAVATHDGRLVVAVSPNSDEWLKNKNTVDSLSDAAYKPLVSTTGTHWDQSAIMMMKQIMRAKRTSTTSSASLISTIIMLLILLALFSIVAIILFRKNRIQRQILAGIRKARRRHARHR